MNTGRSIIIAALFGCWAVLLASRVIAAAIYATAPAANYKMGLVHVGRLLPISAWFCFTAALAMLVCALARRSGQEKADE
jgi:hypothetical protein